MTKHIKKWYKTICKTIYKDYVQDTDGSRGVSESMDGRGCAILAPELVPKNLIFA